MEPYYQDDSTTIYHGDCREILPSLGKFDLLLTDPPYGIGYGGKRNSVGGTDGRLKNGWNTWKTDWDEFPCDEATMQGCVNTCVESIVWGGNYYVFPPSQCWLVWDKMKRDFSLSDVELAWTSFNKASRCFSYSRAVANQKDRVHPTQKPLALMRWCLSFAPNAKTILDPFMGSGTTLVAAKLEGRTAVGIELSERYCEKAANRLRQGVLNFGD